MCERKTVRYCAKGRLYFILFYFTLFFVVYLEGRYVSVLLLSRILDLTLLKICLFYTNDFRIFNHFSFCFLILNYRQSPLQTVISIFKASAASKDVIPKPSHPGIIHFYIF